MRIKARIGLLLGVSLLGFLATYLFLGQLERAETDEMVNRTRDERVQLLSHWLEVTARALPQFAAEAAESEEFARLLASADPTAARARIESEMSAAGATALWIVRTDGTTRFAAAVGGGEPPLPVAVADLIAIARETPNPRFFSEDGRDLAELCLRRLQPGGKIADAWLVVARKWDAARLAALAGLTDATVALEPPHALAQPPGNRGHIVLLRPLNDAQGRPLRALRLDYAAPEIEREQQVNWRRNAVFFAFGLLIIVAFTLAVHAWIVRPLTQIAEALRRDDPAPVQGLAKSPDEFGRLARLVLGSFEQRAALREEIDGRARIQTALERSEADLRRNLAERERLGRDLHDGVIQSLYATGMGLAGIRALLGPEQVEAAARLEQTRTALNETIHDVRNFISGLEPEALRLQTFANAVTALVDMLRGTQPFESTVSIDEAVAAQLTLAQRVNALQIAREAISNALRHGAATRVSIALRADGDRVEFDVTDNGTGFEPGAPSAHAGGLTGFAARARELGAVLNVQSEPGRGARVQLLFSLHS